jgi:2-dehydropantoate 2-reductase
MRILVVGAGAIGGYFGGRLLAAGRDVTFLVRSRRAQQLASTGLIIRSQFGDANLPSPPTIAAEALREPYDLILLSCKAYDLEGAATSFAPAVGAKTGILPLLNGMAHMDYLAGRFGGGAMLGGQCQISTTLDAEGRILHLNDFHRLSFGETDGSLTARAQSIAAALANAGFESRLSEAILQEMWDKWVMIATVAGITCLMRATVGDIVAAKAGDLASGLLDECTAIAAAHGRAPRAQFVEFARNLVTTPGSTFAASMLRDIEHGSPIEADHIIGDLLRRGEPKRDYPVLRMAQAHLKAYEARRGRESTAAKPA